MIQSSYYTEQGQRLNNEDFVAFSERVFVVCDGVGGQAKGEVASRYVAENLVANLSSMPPEVLSKALVQRAIFEVQQGLNRKADAEPETKGMGTTLTLVVFTPEGLIAAHIGDSRIYLVSQTKQQYWRTTDHSYVAELVKAGIINEEEARTHSMRNRISRAIVGDSERKTDQPDIVEVTNLQRGDLVLLCSDGVLEAFDDVKLLQLLADKGLSVEQKIAEIRKGCLGVSRDNNTALLLEVEEDRQRDDQLLRKALPWQQEQALEAVPQEKPKAHVQKNEAASPILPKSNRGRTKRGSRLLLWIFVFLAAALLTFWLLKWVSPDAKPARQRNLPKKEKKREAKNRQQTKSVVKSFFQSDTTPTTPQKTPKSADSIRHE